MTVLEDEEASLEDLSILDEDQLLIEVRNKDLTWPEEMGSLQDRRRSCSGKLKLHKHFTLSNAKFDLSYHFFL